MRLTVALNVTLWGVNIINASTGATLTDGVMAFLAFSAGIALMIGFLTPFASAYAAAGYLWSCVSPLLATDAARHEASAMAVDLMAVSIALVMLGPGAFSIDARLFGRREIIIPKGRPPSQ